MIDVYSINGQSSTEPTEVPSAMLPLSGYYTQKAIRTFHPTFTLLSHKNKALPIWKERCTINNLSLSLRSRPALSCRRPDIVGAGPTLFDACVVTGDRHA